MLKSNTQKQNREGIESTDNDDQEGRQWNGAG